MLRRVGQSVSERLEPVRQRWREPQRAEFGSKSKRKRPTNLKRPLGNGRMERGGDLVHPDLRDPGCRGHILVDLVEVHGRHRLPRERRPMIAGTAPERYEEPKTHVR